MASQLLLIPPSPHNVGPISPVAKTCSESELSKIGLERQRESQRVVYGPYLKSTKTERYIQERRVLGFSFKPQYAASQHATCAQDFFKTLVAPVDFPRGEEFNPFSVYLLLLKIDG